MIFADQRKENKISGLLTLSLSSNLTALMKEWQRLTNISNSQLTDLFDYYINTLNAYRIIEMNERKSAVS